MSFISINPANGLQVGEYPADTDDRVQQKIAGTHAAWLDWRTVWFEERANLLRQLAEVLMNKKDELAALMAVEMGKPVKDGRAEIEKCARVCEYYADHGASFLSDQHVNTEATRSYVSFQPLGVVLAVMPWNFPFWQVFRFLAPALMAGNCGVLKHASNVPGCALAIEALVREAGFPSDVLQTLMIGSDRVESVISHPLIKAATLTGSTEAGKKVAQQAAARLKKTVLELGGSDPYLVLEDADPDHAATVCANSRLINNGQSCIAAKRFIVMKSIEQEFTQKLKERMQQKKWGDPFDPATDLGPMARVDLRDELHRQVQDNIRAGAKCMLGGRLPSMPGEHAYYEPTLLTGVQKGMSAYSEELFGPVAAVISAADEEEAIAIANDTSFGLGAAVFTRDVKRGEAIARNRLQAGSCFVNSLVKSDPRLPFGGIKQSGYGRELGIFGIHEFVNIKTLYVE